MASSNQSTSNISVSIHIEPTDEYKIQEISYDGQEKYIPPLSMSENLSQLIQKLDFNQPIEELREELEKDADTTKPDGYREESTSETSSHRAGTQSQLPASSSSWPFDSMRTKLRSALTEICVLNDVLAIAKEKKYMVFDTIKTGFPDQRPIVNLYAKKEALAMSAKIMLDGSASLRQTTGSDTRLAGTSDGVVPMDVSTSSMDNTSLASKNEPNFYDELKEMRRNWRLKRVGNNIFGDLSYFRPIGYRFTANSRFEVIKTSPGARGRSNQALAVKVPPDLEGKAFIQVSIIKNDDISLVDLSTCANGRLYEPVQSVTWQEKLESAQNVLFCKELFSHLANQAVQYQFVIPTTVAGNQIILALFPDIKLYITLVHKTPNTKCSRELSDAMKKLQKEHKPVLEHSLHQILKDFYASMLRKMQDRDIPRQAGPCAIDKQTLFEISRQESSLDKLVNQAQHLIMRQQVMEVIDTFAAKIKDPLIISHWFCWNSPVTSIVRVDIVSHNNEILGRSHMLIYIGTRQLRVITRDCKNLVLGYEPDELRHLLLWQSCLHQFIASDKLSKLLGWYTMILNHSVNVTRQDISSTAFSLVICSSNCKHMISIKSGPQYGLTVEVAQFKEPIGASINDLRNASSAISGSAAGNRLAGGDLHREPLDGVIETNGHLSNGCGPEKRLNKLQDLVDHFREVDWGTMQGRDFLTKLELLMAALTDLN